MYIAHCSLLRLHLPSLHLLSLSLPLGSSHTGLLASSGFRSFALAVASAWNGLPEISHTSSLLISPRPLLPLASRLPHPFLQFQLTLPWSLSSPLRAVAKATALCFAYYIVLVPSIGFGMWFLLNKHLLVE